MTMKITPKRRYPPMKLQDVIVQMTTNVTLTALKTSVPITFLGYDAMKLEKCLPRFRMYLLPTSSDSRAEDRKRDRNKK